MNTNTTRLTNSNTLYLMKARYENVPQSVENHCKFSINSPGAPKGNIA
jgi:hypothetical protein